MQYQPYNNDLFGNLPSPVPHMMRIPDGDGGTRKTISEMRRCIIEGSTHPLVREQAIRIIRGCASKDFACELKAIFTWVQQNLRWNRDIHNTETIQAVIRTLDWGGGDCDDLTCTLLALLRTVGFPVRLKVIAADSERPDEFSHVYGEAWLDGSWIALDPSPVGAGIGWEYREAFRVGIFNVD